MDCPRKKNSDLNISAKLVGRADLKEGGDWTASGDLPVKTGKGLTYRWSVVGAPRAWGNP